MSEEGAGPTDRGPGRPVGSKASERQAAAGRANLKKAHAARSARKQARKQAPPEKPRWKQLEDGDITVADLTDKELRKRACSNNDGSWEGRRRQLPTRVISRMEAEETRRWRATMRTLVRPAMKAMRTRIDDDDNPAQQFAAARMAIEYGIGKVPDVVHVGAETEFDRMTQTAFVIRRGADLAKELEQGAQVGSDEDIVDAEIVEA